MPKDYYHDLLLPELIRYAKLETMDPENLDEYGAAIFSIWYTQDPLGMGDREHICNFDESETEEDPVICDKKSAVEAYGNIRLGETPQPKRRSRTKKRKGVRFTAHTHPGEPLEPSPDDQMVYDRLRALYPKKAEEKLVNFIIDGYICRKVEE